MSHFQKLIEESKRQRERDKELWANLPNTCQICDLEDYADMRSLLISMLYDLKEVSAKFLNLYLVFSRPMFGLRMCKGCRAALMTKLSEWIQEKGRLRFKNLNEDGLVSSTSWPVKLEEGKRR